jgi:hypothetical protein
VRDPITDRRERVLHIQQRQHSAEPLAVRSGTTRAKDDVSTWISDTDVLRMVGINAREAMVAALKCMAWPGSAETNRWRRQANTSRLKASDWAKRLQHRRRLQAVNVDFLYDTALMSIRNSHAVAVVLEPDAAEARQPRPLPEVCPLKLRELLDVDEAGGSIGCDLSGLFD